MIDLVPYKLKSFIANGRSEELIELLLGTTKRLGISESYNSLIQIAAQEKEMKLKELSDRILPEELGRLKNTLNFHLLHEIELLPQKVFDDLYNSQETYSRLFHEQNFAEREQAWSGQEYESKLANYLENLKLASSYVKVLGMPYPMPLASLQVKVRFHSGLRQYSFRSSQELEDSFDRENRTLWKEQEDFPAHQLLANHKNILIVGKPGIGKTTFLKTVILDSIAKRSATSPIPVYLPLKNISRAALSILEAIGQEMTPFGISSGEINHLLDQGQLLILLDGLDEVSKENIPAMQGAIEAFQKQYTNNQYIVSSRAAAFEKDFEHFSTYEVADFGDQQILSFVKNWFLDEERATICFRDINNDASVKELARVPLLLTLICIAYEEKKIIPANRGVLYKIAIDILLEQWDRSRGIIRQNNQYKSLNAPAKIALYTSLAHKMFQERQLFIDLDLLSRYLADFLQAAGLDQRISPEAGLLDFINTLIYQHGLIFYQARRVVAFAHLSFLEHFQARAIRQLPEQDIEQIITEKAFNSDWVEVVNHVIGLSASKEIENYLLIVANAAKLDKHLDPEAVDVMQQISVIFQEEEFALGENILISLLCYLRAFDNFYEAEILEKFHRRILILIERFFLSKQALENTGVVFSFERLPTIDANSLLAQFEQKYEDLNLREAQKKAEEVCELTYDIFIGEMEAILAVVNVNIILLNYLIDFRGIGETTQQYVFNSILNVN